MQEYANPVEQVMFILGFKHDPRFSNVLEAVASGASPGILDAAEVVTIYGAIHANFVSLSKVVEKIRNDFRTNLPPEYKHEVHKLILQELAEDHYGGRWYERAAVPANWVSMERYSSIFAKEHLVFCLPLPYVRLLQPVI